MNRDEILQNIHSNQRACKNLRDQYPPMHADYRHFMECLAYWETLERAVLDHITVVRTQHAYDKRSVYAYVLVDASCSLPEVWMAGLSLYESKESFEANTSRRWDAIAIGSSPQEALTNGGY